MSAPRYLKTRGLEIWAAYSADDLPAGSRSLIHELARLADTLDKLDAILGNREDSWAKIELDEGTGELTLIIDGLMGERRQQQLAFKQLMGEIRQAGIKETGGRVVEESEGRGGLILSLIQGEGIR